MVKYRLQGSAIGWREQDPPPPDPPTASGPAHPAASAAAAAGQPAADQHSQPPGSDQFICKKYSLQVGNKWDTLQLRMNVCL